MSLKFNTFNLFLLIVLSLPAHGQRVKLRLENLFSLWGGLGFSDPLAYQFGGRYIPSFSLSDSLNRKSKLDVEVSANAHLNFDFKGKEFNGTDKEVKPYRAWIRYSTPRLELRAGLQKINFGSASVLRPLMWFDKMDYRDPLQLTEGIYGFLGRYYFQNNTNIWLWALYGNDKTKGWEVAATKKKSPEFGGRLQFPLPRGEAAVSFHRRMADYKALYPPFPDPGNLEFPEEKVALDGKWDLGVGLSVEGVLKHNDPGNGILKEWETYMSLGVDYTFNLGNGLSLSTEFFRYENRQDWKNKGTDTNYSVVTCSYSINLINSVMAMVYYNWDDKEWFRIISIQRKYDYWSFYLMAFWNPDSFNLYGPSSGRNLFAGKGIQLMAVLNY